MGLPTNIFAYTAPGADFPEYISVNEVEGKVEVSVRSARYQGEHVGVIALTQDQAADMAHAVLQHLTVVLPARSRS